MPAEKSPLARLGCPPRITSGAAVTRALGGTGTSLPPPDTDDDEGDGDGAVRAERTPPDKPARTRRPEAETMTCSRGMYLGWGRTYRVRVRC